MNTPLQITNEYNCDVELTLLVLSNMNISTDVGASDSVDEPRRLFAYGDCMATRLSLNSVVFSAGERRDDVVRNRIVVDLSACSLEDVTFVGARVEFTCQASLTAFRTTLIDSNVDFDVAAYRGIPTSAIFSSLVVMRSALVIGDSDGESSARYALSDLRVDDKSTVYINRFCLMFRIKTIDRSHQNTSF